MGIRTGKAYIEGLRRRRPEVWLHGRRISDVTAEPLFQQPMREVARLYDLQHDPAHQPHITHVAADTGERVSNAFLRPASLEDLRARRALFETWARATYGLMGRSPDFLNVTLTAFASNAWFFERLNPEWAERLLAYYRYVRDGDLFLTHAIINPQNDRSRASHQQADPYLHLGVVRETPEGLVVRGAKMLATLAPLTDEVLVYPFPGLRPGDEPYALAFAVPIDAPGLRIVCRESVQPARLSAFDHPLAARFEEMDAILVFHDVLVPWSRVFLYGNVEAANALYPETGLWQQPAHQTAVRGLEKLTLVTAVAVKLAESIGIDGFLNVQEQLGELIEGVEAIRALLDSAETHWEKTPWGEARPAAHPLETIRGLMPRLYPRAVEVLQTLGAGGLLLSPTEGDFAHPELAADLDHYWVGKPGVSGRERVRLFKLAWDLCGEAFGQRLLQYERYYAGDPYRMRALRYLRYPKEALYERVERILREAETLAAEAEPSVRS